MRTRTGYLFFTQIFIHEKEREEIEMSKLLRGVVAGAGAWKLGGGCFTTVIIFVLLWWFLGNFNIFQ